jgi:ABC-2 type transport system ATP-binding protein
VSADPAVVVDALRVVYSDLEAVAGVSFTARHGEVTAVLGPNGAGKTSTIEVCEGFRRPSSGTVRVLGLDPGRDRRRLTERMGVMLQEGGVYPSARPLEMVELYTALHGRGADPRELLAQVGLAERARTSWRRLSGGEKQRLSLALALAARPDVAFLDEPTSGVDANGRATIREIVRDLAEGGCAVVLASHELDETERIADRVIVFDRGLVVADGALDEIRGGTREMRIRTATPIDHDDLARSIGHPVIVIGATEYLVESADRRAMAHLSVWLADHGVDVVDMRAGAARLEDVFRRLTTDAADPDTASPDTASPDTARPDTSAQSTDGSDT